MGLVKCWNIQVMGYGWRIQSNGQSFDFVLPGIVEDLKAEPWNGRDACRLGL